MNAPKNSEWRPACALDTIRLRARLNAAIRLFFFDRDVVEVETPILSRAIGTDPNLNFFSTQFNQPGQSPGTKLFLQTSPEFAMKRLLAAETGSIYQICKAFRNEEQGRYHNPEFTVLEWYRIGFDSHQLMDEISALIKDVSFDRIPLDTPERVSYQEIFFHHTQIDPLTASISDFAEVATRFKLHEANSLCGDNPSLWLDILFSHLIQQSLGRGRLTFVYDYPASQAALAKIHPQDYRIADRFEVFLQGTELANGFQELTDGKEQEQRFDAELAQRQAQGQPLPAKDHRFLQALDTGLPECAGVALGLDRLLMLMANASRIDDVLAFPLERC